MSDLQSSKIIENLQARQASANKKIIQLQTEHNSVSEQLSEAWDEIKEIYQVDNLDALRALYTTKKNERDTKLKDSEKELLEIEAVLKMIDDGLNELKA
jgi:predicted transcriptional regulator